MIDCHNLYRKMLTIRRFEERLLELYSLGDLFGTTHTCIGQEAVAVGVLNNLKRKTLLSAVTDAMAIISL